MMSDSVWLSVDIVKFHKDQDKSPSLWPVALHQFRRGFISVWSEKLFELRERYFSGHVIVQVQ